ncbi:MAG: dicarboxylate/amino acid:cation symporter [Bacteroidetes bacterium]|nr:MAG: dicarboxylate/amino acid:cation symporter [Bacteroidota bacterium]
MFKKLPLHTKILIGLVLGIVWGVIAANLGWAQANSWYVAPLGKIFVNLLKLIAIPMIITSLVVGVASLNDINKLGRIGGRTLGIFIITTVFAVTIGLVLASIIRPGDALSEETKNNLINSYQSSAAKKTEAAQTLTQQSPLQPLVDIFPENLISAASNNQMMLSMVVIAILFGIATILVPAEKSQPLITLMNSANEVTLKVVDIIMLLAPIGVFALISSVITDLAGSNPAEAVNLLLALAQYCGVVLLGLLLHAALVYMSMVKFIAKLNPIWFLKKMRPVHLLAFSTSSSNATLPLNMENTEKNMGVHEEITSFVLPLGATVNMDGTSLYQSVAAIFIAQVFNIDLSFTDQLLIIVTATLASVGSAGVPGAGMVMLAIVLNSVGIPVEGIALIMGPDRILDMCRTVVNVTGDTTVATVIARNEGKIVPVE